MDLDALAPNLERLNADLTDLSSYAAPEAPGWTRRSYSDPYRASRSWVRERMTDAGLDVSEDAVGNLIGRTPGSRGAGGALVTGSHTDTVHGGGRFDGVVGVMGAIEMARRLRETDTRLDHDLWVVDFIGEEISEFGTGCIGSQAIIGALPTSYFDMRRNDGQRLAEAMSDFGCNPSDAMSVAWD